METVVLNFLGPVRFERAGVPVPLVRAKAVALLLYLAIMREAQPRERVLDLLWPESLPEAGRKNMRNTLWTIREALGDEVLKQGQGTLRLAADVQVDVHGLEDGLLLLESSSVPPLETAAKLRRGPLADGLVVHEAPEFEIWLQTERQRMEVLYLRLLERIIMLRRAAGAWQEVIVQAQRALAADPLREPLHLALIEAYVRSGQRAEAMQQYATLTSSLRREMEVAPLPETTARYEALLADVALPAAEQPPPSIIREQESVPFVGRETELAALNHERSRAMKGKARVVLITGDLGMGKTRLWQTWGDTHKTDMLVLRTHALETTEPVPFGPILSLFRQPGPAHASVHPPSPLATLWLTELARLLPELALAWPNLPPPLALAPAEERGRLLQALTEALRLLLGPLLVLVIDDLHWADPSTLDWLIYLVDQLHDTPLLVIGTYRAQDAPERLLTAVAGWQRQGHVRHLPLDHLSQDEAEKLLSALGIPDDPEAAATLLQQSGGNPYFLIELQRAGAGNAAGDLRALVRARLQTTVPVAAMQVLQAAAVLGDGASFPLLQAASGRSEEETLDALDALQAAAVLVPQDRGYHFVHPLVATVVRDDLRPARRTFLHRRAAEALERIHASDREQVAGPLMEHYAAAGDLLRAARAAEQAAAQALRIGAFVEAAAYARRANTWEPTARRQLLLGEALLPGGSAGEAEAQLQSAVQGFEDSDDVLGAARACLGLAMIAIGRTEPDVARRWLAPPSVQHLEAVDPALCAQALLLAAGVERQSEMYDAALRLLDRADELTRKHHLGEQAGHIAIERGNLLANRGDLHGGIRAFAEAVRLAEESGMVVQAATAWNNLAYHTLLAGDVEQAQRHIAVALELTERYALSFLGQYVWSTSGEIALAREEFQSAEGAFEHAFEAAQAWNNYVHMANVRVNQARVAQARSRSSEARALVDEAQALLGESVDPFVRNKVEQIRMELARV
jgi:DNA-binding SARP family transcriptional activator